MGHKFELTKQATKDLDSLDASTVKRIIKKLQWITERKNPLQYGKYLTDPAIGDIRFRVGNYRVIVVIDEKKKELVVVSVGHRREIYRR